MTPADRHFLQRLIELGRLDPARIPYLEAELTRRGGRGPMAHLALELGLLTAQELASWQRSQSARLEASASLSEGVTHAGATHPHAVSLSTGATHAGSAGTPAPGSEREATGQSEGFAGPQAEADLQEEVQRALAAGARRRGKYIVLAELGRGAMGQVHRAYDPTLQRVVAIKELLPKAGATPAQEATRRERFLREGRAVARLRHPNIVEVIEVVDGEPPCLVMGFVQGCDLAELLEREELSVREVVRLVRQVAEALGHAHQAGVVHRDVKPANVLIQERRDERQALLSDFGLARRTEGAESELSREGELLGTPLYLSPEQAKTQHREVRPPATCSASAQCSITASPVSRPSIRARGSGPCST